MEKLTRTSELYSCTLDEIPSEYQDLVSQSKNALKGSYSPYSEFAVGAALLLESGIVVKGANQENAAYPSGLCAERVYPNQKIKALAVCIAHPLDKWPFPCGSCLQVMAESRERQAEEIEILLCHPVENKVLWTKGVVNLLPFAFNRDYLEP